MLILLNFDIRVAIKDVERRALGANARYWPPKLIEYIHDRRALPTDLLMIDRL